MSTRFFESANLQRKLWKYMVIYSTVLFFLVSQKRPTFCGSILAALLVRATTTIDICCATFFCTKNRVSSRRHEFSVPDSRTKTGRDVSLLAKLSLFYLSLGSKKISGDFGGSIGTNPWKFKAFEPKSHPIEIRNIDFQTSLVFGWGSPCSIFQGVSNKKPSLFMTVSKFAPCLAKYQKLTQKL